MEKLLLFLNMGGYGFYVWTAYALTFFLLLGYYLYQLLSYKKDMHYVIARAARLKPKPRTLKMKSKT